VSYKELSYCWFQKPKAFHYVGIHERTYFGFYNIFKQVCIAYFDHDTDSWSDTEVIDTLDNIDDHNAPAMLIDASGYIYAFYAEHTGSFSPLYCRKSSNVEDITSWAARATVVDNAAGEQLSYPNPVILTNGDIWVFYRKSAAAGAYPKKEYYSVSSDDGGSWGGETEVYNVRNAYVVIVADDIQAATKIHLALSEYNDTDDAYKNINYMYYDTSDSKWKKRDGTEITLPAAQDTADRVCISSAGTSCWGDYIYDIKLISGEPYLAWVVFDNSVAGNYKFAKYAAGWQVSTITGSEGNLPSGYAGGIVIKDATTVYLSKRVGQINEIQKWILNGSWGKDKDMTEESIGDNLRPYLAHDYNDNLALFWRRGLHEAWLDDWDCRLKWSPEV